MRRYGWLFVLVTALWACDDAGIGIPIVPDTTVDAQPSDGARPDGAISDGAIPDGALADGARPDGARPDGARPDGATPDGATADGATPDAALPDSGQLGLSVSAPEDGLAVNSSPVVVEGQVNAAANVTVNGAEAVLDGQRRFSVSVELNEGPNPIAVVATAGDQRAEVQLSVTLDTVAPALSLVTPLDGSTSNQAAIEVTGTLDDAAAALTLNGQAVPHAEGEWSVADFVLARGPNVLVAVATDAAGNTTEARTTVIFDPDAPVLTVEGPEAATFQNDTTVTLRGTASGPGVSVTVNGEAVEVGADGVFEVVLQLPEGEHVIVVEATSAGGTVTRTTRTVTIDLTAPTLVVTAPAPGAQLIRRVVQVEGSLDEPGTVRIGELEHVLAAAGDWTIEGVALVEGANIIQVSATDTAGNQRQIQVAVEVDTVPPVVTVTSPEDGLVLRAGTIDVQGTAVAADLATVELNGVVVEVAEDGSFSVEGLALEEGRNNITAIATDAFGNVGLSRVVVFRDTLAPMLRIETPRDGEILTSTQVDLAGICNDLVAGVTVGEEDVRIWVNGQEAQVLNRTFVLPDLLLQRGPNVIQVEAVDTAGNRANRTLRVTVDPQAGQRVVLISGNSQRVEPGEALEAPLVISLLSANGDPVPGELVVFEVSRGDGEIVAFPDRGRVLTVLTDENGLASVGFEPGARSGAGSHRVIAHAPGFVGRVEFCHSVVSGAADRITTVDGEVQTGAVGAQLADEFIALVVDADGNVARNVAVRFRVVKGEGLFAGAPEVVVQTDADGLARATATLGAAGDHVFAATFEGFVGEPATFRAKAVAPGARDATRVVGRVLDNQDRPIPGATAWIRLPAGPVISARTDENGAFVLNRAPVGPMHLVVDGGTSTREDGKWPSIQFNMVTVAGESNSLGRTIYLPRMDMDGMTEVGGPQDVTLHLAGIPGAELTVFADSVTCENGEPMCSVTWSQVRAERVPDAPPMGSNFTMVWTTQPSGIRFDPPARVCLPNPGHPAGHQMEIFSFDHDLSTWVGLGTATVTEDGLRACTDEGFGLFKTGWGGAPPPPPPPKCPSNCQTDNPCKSGSCVDGSCKYEDTNEGGRCDDRSGCGEAICESGSCNFSSKEADDTPCDDRNACTEVDVCKDGACVGAPELDCDDGNDCTEDECDPATGCVNWPQDGTGCTPEGGGSDCVEKYECVAGTCVDTPKECEQDENPCTESQCQEGEGCVEENINELGSCENDAECGEYICEEGACVPDDGQAGTDDTECDDEDECTDPDECTDGQCTGETRDLEKVEGGVVFNFTRAIGPLKDRFESLVNRVPWLSMSFGGGAFKSTVFKEDCCEADSGFVRFGKVGGGAELGFSAGLTATLPGLGITQEFSENVGDNRVEFSVEVGIFADLSVGVKGTVSTTENQCLNEAECIEAGGALTLQGGLSARVQVRACVEIGFFNVSACPGLKVEPAAIVMTMSGNVSYKSGGCAAPGFSGSVTLGQIKFVMEIDYLFGVFTFEHVLYQGL